MTPEENLKEIELMVRALLDKEGARLGYEITFPIYNILPDEVKLAYSILLKHGMTVTITVKKK